MSIKKDMTFLDHLEQLRWVDNGIPIKVAETTLESISIDTPQDFKKITNKREWFYKNM